MGNLLALAIAAEASFFFKSTLPLAAYVVGSIGLAAWQSRSADHLRWYRRIRPDVVVQDLVVLAAVIGAAAALLSLDNPVLNFGWYQFLVQDVGGDPSGGGNIITAPFSYRALIVPFVGLLLFVLPRLAETEELIFRRGTRTWRQGIARSFVFGLVHMLVGVPLAVALALGLGGLWFTYQYFQGGVARSTVYHLTYNLIVLGMVAVVSLVGLG